MLDAITASQVAMLQDNLRLQTISHNISNIETPGFKRQILEATGFEELYQAELQTVSQKMSTGTQQVQGTLVATHDPHDLALTGEGFFEVQNDEGIFYTRRGDFHVNEQGEIVTASRAKLLGKNSALIVEDNKFTIDVHGNLSIDNHQIDQINIVRFAHPQALRYLGNGLYESLEAPITTRGEATILQGYLEKSNVTSMDEMMNMVRTSRHFEASQRIMKTMDNLLSTAISQLGEGNV